MTLLVAVKIPTNKLNPLSLPIRFVEKGILMVADTRFSMLRGARVTPQADDTRKLWAIADCALAGYAGRLEVAEPALVSAHVALTNHAERQWKFVVTVIQNYMRYWFSKIPNPNEPTSRTTVLVGIKTGAASFRLFLLDSIDDFKRKEPSELIVIGSGKKKFDELFQKELRLFTKNFVKPLESGLKVEQRGGKVVVDRLDPGAKVEIRHLQCASLIMATTDYVIEDENIPTVGGFNQAISFTKEGFTPLYGSISSHDSASWRKMTLTNLRSYNEIARKKYEIPPIDQEGRVRP